jgi:hypothetical protein
VEVQQSVVVAVEDEEGSFRYPQLETEFPDGFEVQDKAGQHGVAGEITDPGTSTPERCLQGDWGGSRNLATPARDVLLAAT